MLGFNGITTFRNADNVGAVVDATPVERIVLETDAPYPTCPLSWTTQRTLLPALHRGKAGRN